LFTYYCLPIDVCTDDTRQAEIVGCRLSAGWGRCQRWPTSPRSVRHARDWPDREDMSSESQPQRVAAIVAWEREEDERIRQLGKQYPYPAGCFGHRFAPPPPVRR
jgi:hypothetical protein